MPIQSLILKISDKGGQLESLRADKKLIVKTVLFIDDDRFTQGLVATALEDSFKVIAETAGANALPAAELCQPQLILLDLAMPNVDGFDVLMRLKGHPILSSIPVICLSGKQDETSRNRAYKLGASGFIQKPVDVKLLSKDIEGLLNSMNLEFSSKDGRKTIFVGFNEKEIMSKMKSDIKFFVGGDKGVVVLSFSEGSDFFSNFSPEEKAYTNGDFIFLQIKPAFITRLPYLENLSSITGELKALIDSDPTKYVILFDEPEAAFSSSDSETTKASALLLGQAISQIFPKIKYYMKTSTDQGVSYRINELAKLLIGNF